MQTTVGQLLINEALPPDLRDYNRKLDKAGIKALMREVATKYPERYVDVAQKLMNVGQSTSTTGNFSFSLQDFRPPLEKRQTVEALRAKVRQLIDHPSMDTKTRENQLTMLLGGEVNNIIGKVLDGSLKNGSKLAEVVKSGSKGNAVQFNTTVGAPLMFTDHKNEPVPIPVFNSLSEGFDPAEYWASTYGTRQAAMQTKMAVADAGYFGKKLSIAAGRLVITQRDCGTKNGMITPGSDKENVGTIVQHDIGNIKAGTILKPEHLKELNDKQIMVRSPITCEAEHGLCSKCAGIRDRGTLPDMGDNIGMSAASALGERLSQNMLSSKHTSGAAGAKRSYSYEDIERLFEMPKSSGKFAQLTEEDGVVKSIRPSPTGGVLVAVGNKEYWAPDEASVRLKVGQHTEAGELVSDGIPNPAELARHRGIGDARKEFTGYVQEVTGGSVSRRNAEVLSRGMINHVKVNHPHGLQDVLVGDTARYDDITRNYEPRPGHKALAPTQAKGMYLEQPALHYTIGTKVTDRVIKDLQATGIKNIVAHKDAPGFEPHVQQMLAHSQVDPDWMTRMSGYHLKASIPDAVHRGMTSQEHSTSYVPALAKGVEFGVSIKETGEY